MDLVDEATAQATHLRWHAKLHPGHGFAGHHIRAAEMIERLIGEVKLLRMDLEETEQPAEA